jgi:hypothetical protein
MNRLYTPHNSGADLYPYLILTAHLTDPDLYYGRLMEMLRNEIRYTTVQESIPSNLEMSTGQTGPPSLFSAGEYAKDGLLAVTEYLGRTPWFHRMVDMVADAMNRAPVDSRFGKLPASDAELNGDYMQALMRLATMTGDSRFRAWGRRIADAYMWEVLPGNHGVPSGKWDFSKHSGDGRLKLRDHGNETIVGLVLQFALEQRDATERFRKWRPGIAKMLDRVLESANSDGMLYNEVDAATLKPLNHGLSDNWGYVYGAVYSFYQCTGVARYRDAVRRFWRICRNIAITCGKASPRRRCHTVLLTAMPTLSRARFISVPEALDWIDSEMKVMMAMQKPNGHIENWYGEGNYNRTGLLYALMKSQGVRPESWQPGVRVGAVRDGSTLYLSLAMRGARRIQFDFARHRRTLNLDRDYVRLNEFPEWYTVDENKLYRIHSGNEVLLRLGSEMIAGIEMAPGEWTVEPMGDPPYARSEVK